MVSGSLHAPSKAADAYAVNFAVVAIVLAFPARQLEQMSN